MNRLLDLRFVIGIFFIILSLLLMGYSFFSADSTPSQQSLNRICGIVFGVFGLLMVILSLKKDAHDELV